MTASMACFNTGSVMLHVFFTTPLLCEHLIVPTVLIGTDWTFWEPPMMVSAILMLNSYWEWLLCSHVPALLNPTLLGLSLSTLKVCGMRCWLSFPIELTCRVGIQILYLLLPCYNWAMWSSKSKPPICPLSIEFCPPTPETWISGIFSLLWKPSVSSTNESMTTLINL